MDLIYIYIDYDSILNFFFGEIYNEKKNNLGLNITQLFLISMNWNIDGERSLFISTTSTLKLLIGL